MQSDAEAAQGRLACKRAAQYGDVKVSTGNVKQEQRVVVRPHFKCRKTIVNNTINFRSNRMVAAAA